MVSTRSKTAQTHFEDFTTKDNNPFPERQPASPKNAAPKANTSRKRKSTSTETEEAQQSPKRTKTSPSKPKTETTDDRANDVVKVNRAPVLHLWAASVAHHVHSELEWETCLSAGSAISTICAVAKGRSVGTIAEKDDDSNSSKDKKQDEEEIEVMHFKLRIKDGLAVVGGEGKGKSGGEDALKKKFGDGEYERTKRVFEEALRNWEGSEEVLNGKAFHMYEDFRPDVSKGQKGLGGKGELKLQTVRDVVGKREASHI
ncbi:hypothetical protein E8E12_006778 [Didymella heteroderae]|uniref:Uncharacterized protein n=1 Tax=Didymella heteroderae TaxID=1769908 RepID=A0A9P5C029_9PLEO|nr:hypothetical protein E8E12_006778 [Didymella heteroderae]